MKSYALFAGLFASTSLAVSLASAAPQSASLSIRSDASGPVISPNIYGQFAEHLGHGIYGGIWVGENSPIPNTRGVRNDVAEALRNLKVPFVRWPGGCFADEYHWKDGIGPRELRPRIINTNWGGVVEDNSFGTHEFFDFCEQIGTQAYVSGNVGSGTVQEMMEWVEYMTSDANSPMANLRRKNGHEKAWKVPFFGIGNEAWGCGGNMRPEFYADVFRRYVGFVKDYGPEKIQRVASGPSGDDYPWTETLMSRALGNPESPMMHGLSLHYYTIPTGTWVGSKGAGTGFPESEWFSTLENTLKMEEFVTKHSAIMDKYDPKKKVGLAVDEWGTWCDVDPGSNPGFLRQAASLRDAMVAAINLNIFHAHADRVNMSAIAQMVNVLQAMILTEGDKMVLTPTYHVFEMYKVHQGAVSLPLSLKSPPYAFNGKFISSVSATASRAKDGRIHISITNVNPHDEVVVSVDLQNDIASVSGRILTGPAMDTANTFSSPHQLEPAPFKGFSASGKTLKVTLPPMSVVALEL